MYGVDRYVLACHSNEQHRTSLAALVISFFTNLLKGIAIYESVSCVVVALMLFGVRKSFTREGRIPLGWLNLVSAGFGGLALFWLIGLAAFENIPYRPDLWLEFTFNSDAARFIRVGALAAVMVVFLLVREALQPAKKFVTPSEHDIQAATTFAQQHSNSADSLLVAGADKAVWWFGDKGLLLYQTRGNKFFVYRNPILQPGTSPEAFLKAFFEYCDEQDMDPVLSIVSLEWIEHLHEFGFHFLKISEEAEVNLVGYSMDGSDKADFRRILRNVEKADMTYEVLCPPFSSEFIESLGQVSDQWLAAKGGHELQFSACYFSPGYIALHPVGVARASDGEVIAFVNILCTRVGGPSSIDFMRYTQGKVDNVMDYVMIKTQLYLAGQGYISFSLGTAPMTDVGQQKNARWMERLMFKLSERAEHIYNYKGLRFYKNKFDPEWAPRYLAYQYPWDVLTVMSANARLVQARSVADKKRIDLARHNYSQLPPAVGDTQGVSD